MTINGEVQPLSGSSRLFDAVVYGSVSEGCEGPAMCSNNPCVGEEVCVDEWYHYSCVSASGDSGRGALHVGVIVIIIFFSVLFVVLLVTFVVFRRRRHLREKKAQAATYTNPSSDTAPSPSDSGYVNSESDILRGHVQKVLKKKYTENGQPRRPDIIERSSVPDVQVQDSTSRLQTVRGNVSAVKSSVPDHTSGHSQQPIRDAALTLPNPMQVDDGTVIIENCDTPVPPIVPPRLEPVEEETEHYDLENASSIAPSDIDVVYHYRDYRDGRHPPLPRAGGRPPPPYRQPHSLFDIADANETSADLNSSSNSNNSNNTSLSTPRRARPPPPPGRRARLKTNPPGLTVGEVEKLNKTRSSLSSAIDNVSSSSGTVTPPTSRKTPLPSTSLPDNQESSSDESGNDSFTCSEFEYDGPSDNPADRLSRLVQERKQKDYDSHGSMSTLVASDEDSPPHCIPQPPPCGNGSNIHGPGVMSWDNLLNWGPNFESLVGVFKDIASLDDGENGEQQPFQQLSGPPVSEEYV